MKQGPSGQLTPVVATLMAINGILGVLLATVFTLPSLHSMLAFDPALASHRPWTFLTHLVVYPGLPGLGASLLLLWLFGPPVEQRMGARSFLAYYLYCGVGAALLALGLSSLGPVPPLLGSGGAVLGVAFAFAVLWPDAYLNLEPLPVRPRVRVLVAVLGGTIAGLSFLLADGTVHLAQLGGMAAGYFFFRIQAVRTRRVEPPPAPLLARPVRTAVTVAHGAPRAVPSVKPPPSPLQRYSTEELDRVLDKISASGMNSLTAEERQFLHQMAARKRKETG
jgi:membrane associated rhomboid family serine protease